MTTRRPGNHANGPSFDRLDGVDGESEHAAPSRRGRVVIRGQVPSRRAMLGALCIGLAAFLTLAAHQSATATTQDRYVIARTSLPALHTLSKSDLAYVSAELPADMGIFHETELHDVLGRTLTRPLNELDIIRESDLLDPTLPVDRNARETTISLDFARLPQPPLQPGELVDVLATDPQNNGTGAVLLNATVIHIGEAGDRGLSRTGDASVTLLPADLDTAQILVDAAIRTELTLVRHLVDTSGDGND